MRAFVCLAAVFFVACSAASEPTASQRAPIISGHASDASQDFTVMLVHDDPILGATGLCTASLLAPNLILTARHCVSTTNGAAFTCDGSGNPSGSGGGIGADWAPSSLIVFYGENQPSSVGQAVAKGTAVYHDNATNLCNHDLALVLIDPPIPNATIAQIRLNSPPTPNESITVVGWGYINDSTFPLVRQQRTNIPIQQIGPFAGGQFQLPVAPNDFMTGEAFCSGDSGGPALDVTTQAIIGIVSAGGNGQPNSVTAPAQTCIGATNFYTRVDGFVDVIQQAYADSGQDPWLEGGPDPRLGKFGDACSAGTDCQSGLCNAGTCTSDCTADPTICPANFACTALSDSQSQCTVPPPGGCNASREPASAPFVPLAALVGLLALRRRPSSAKRSA